MRIAKGSERIRLLRQQQAAEKGRKERARNLVMTKDGLVPSIKVDKSRITLAKLRFMGDA
jgi:hypothetical protein